MTISEFRHWLEGYSSSFYSNYPDISQWEVIKGKLSDIKEQTFSFSGTTVSSSPFVGSGCLYPNPVANCRD